MAAKTLPRITPPKKARARKQGAYDPNLLRFTPAEVVHLHSFLERTREFYSEVTLAESALYAAMCGLQSVQLDTNPPFENYSDLPTCFGNLFHVVLASLHRATSEFDVIDLPRPNLKARALHASAIFTEQPAQDSDSSLHTSATRRPRKEGRS